MEGLSQIGIKKEPSDDPDVQMVCEKADGLEFITVSVDQLITQPARQVTCTMPGCEQVFKSVPMLNFHLIKVHRQTVPGFSLERNQSKKFRRYLCPIKGCKYNSRSRPLTDLSKLKQHYLNIHREKTLPCSKCSIKFSNEKMLKQHEKSCGVIFNCSLCNIPYTTKVALQTHQSRRHSESYLQAKLIIAKQHLDAGKEAASPQGEVTDTRNSTSAQSSILSTKLVSSKRRRANDGKFTSSLRPLLPKPHQTNSSTMTNDPIGVSLGTMTYQPMANSLENCSTQTDLLQKVMQSCQLALHQSTSTEKTRSSSQSTQVSYPAESMPTDWNVIPYMSIAPTNWSSSPMMEVSGVTSNALVNTVEPCDSSTQTFFPQTAAVASGPSTSNTDLGTQTLSSLLEDIQNIQRTSRELQCDRSTEQNSIQLQCDLDDFTATTDLESNQNMSFGTQTSNIFDDFNRREVTDMQSMQTQTLGGDNLEDVFCTDIGTEPCLSDLDLGNELRISTSDFSMQFPYDMSNFGTQTAGSSAGTLDMALFSYEDLLSCSNGDPGIQGAPVLSQSSTQTDLDFLFTNIETQTESIVPM